MPQVLNLRHFPGFNERRPIVPAGAVYIGRRNTRYGLAASQWANPFRVSQEADRASAIAAYEPTNRSGKDRRGSSRQRQSRQSVAVRRALGISRGG
jgi:hypothetical protein